MRDRLNPANERQAVTFGHGESVGLAVVLVTSF